MATTRNWYPLIIIVLLSALVVVFSALVMDRASERTPVGETVETEAQTLYSWTMVTTWPKNFPGLGLAPENFARQVEQISKGRLKIKVHGAGELVPALGVFDAVSSGSVEMGHGAAYYWKGKISAAPFFTSVPFGMNAQEMNGWLYYGGGLELWRDYYKPFNLIPFAGGNTGVQMAGWFNKEIKSVEDIKGTKMRIPGIGGEVWRRAGGVAVNIPGGELYTSLQTGVVDASEWVGPYNDLAFGLYQVAKYYYYPGWHEPGPTLELIVNREAYLSLPEDLQQIISTTAQAVNEDMLAEYTARNNAALKELVEQHGVQVRPLPKEVLDALRFHAKEYYSETAAQDPKFARVYNAYKAFAEQVESYHKISEAAYFDNRP